MKQFQGAVFDLDGTLLDSLGIWERIDREFLGARNIPVPEDYAKEVSALSFSAAAEYTVRRFGLPDSTEQLIAEWNRMAQDEYRFRVELKPGAKEYLSLLRGQGVRLAVATSSYRDLFLPTLRRHGILNWFDSIVTAAEVARGKGFPDIYERAAGQIDCKPGDCVVFEDLPAGLRGARDGGFYTVGVYDLYCAEEEDAMRSLADCYIRDFRELL